MTDERVEVSEAPVPEAHNVLMTVRSHRIYRLLFLLLAIVEVILAFRFVLKLLSAHPDSPFAAFIYTLSSVFLWPFSGLFAPAVSQDGQIHSVFEPSTLVAMVAYYVLVWLIGKGMLIYRGRPRTIRR